MSTAKHHVPLLDTESHYEAIITAMQEGMIVHAADGSIITCNPAAERILGLTEDQIIGRTPTDPQWKTIHEDGSPFPGETHPANISLRTGEAFSDIMMGIHKPEGVLTWVSINSQPLFHAGEAKPYAVIATFTDITARVEAESHIRWLAKFPSENPHPVLRVNAQGIVIYANLSSNPLLDSWGVKLQQPVPEAIRSIITQSLHLESRQEIEVTLKNRVLSLTFSPDSEAKHVNIYGLDITDRKRAEQALQHSEARLAEAQRIAHMGNWEWDIDSGRLHWSDEIYRIFGLAPQSTPATYEIFLNFVHPDDRDKVQRFVDAALYENSVYDMEHRIISADDTEHIVQEQAEVTRDAAGRPTRMIGTVQDITERVQAEIALRESEQTTRMLIESAPVGLVIVDTIGNIVLTNNSATKIFGYTHAELIGQPLNTLLPEDLHAVHGQYCADYFATPYIRPMGAGLELYARHKNGTVFPVEISLGAVETHKGTLAMAFVLDITKRHQAEAKQAELLRDLESANQELKDFAYVVSHDLKAPLRGISSLADWLSTDYSEALDEEGQELITLLLSRVKRMHNLIEGVLQYSRVGRIHEESQAVDLNILVTDIVDALAPPPHITITLDNTLPSLVCERTRMGQVFQNLISNAIKYMDKPAGHIHIGCEDKGNIWQFYVADNGPGIEEQYFEKIFQLFQTLQARDDFESTGVGLAVVKKIVELYGGQIWVTATMEEGSTFFFTLPHTCPDHSA